MTTDAGQQPSLSGAVNPLDGLGRPLIVYALGVFVGMIGLRPEWDVTFLWWGAVMLKLGGLLTLRRRMHGEHAATLRKLIGWLILFSILEQLTTISKHVPGLEPVRWISYAAFGSLVVIAAFEFTIAAYCRRWKLKELAWLWKCAAWLWIVLMIGGAAAMVVRAGLGGQGMVKFDSFVPFAVLSCVWLIPVGMLVVAALNTRGAEQKMRGGCVKCGFDLRALRDPVCPECGQSFEVSRLKLAAPTRRGRSVPWVGLTVLGVMAAALSAGVLWQMPGVMSAAGKPMWLLMRDAHNYVAPGQTPAGGRARPFGFFVDEPEGVTQIQTGGSVDAQAEILIRIKSGEVTRPVANRLMNMALANQSNPSLPMGQWAEIADSLAAAGLSDQDQNRHFFRGAMRFELRVRSKVAVGAPLPFELHLVWRGLRDPGSFFPSSTQASFDLAIDWDSLDCDGVALSPLPPSMDAAHRAMSFRQMIWSPYNVTGGQLLRTALPKLDIAPGLHTVHATVEVHWHARGPAPYVTADEMAARALPRDIAADLKAQVEVVPEGTLTIKLVPCSELSPSKNTCGAKIDVMGTSAVLVPHIVNLMPRASIVADVLVNIDGEERCIGTVYRSRSDVSPLTRIDPEILERVAPSIGNSIMATIRPNVRDAELFVETDEIWGEESAVVELSGFWDVRKRRVTPSTPAPPASDSSPPAPSPPPPGPQKR